MTCRVQVLYLGSDATFEAGARQALGRAGFVLSSESDGRALLDMGSAPGYAAAILDSSLLGVEGSLELSRTLRGRWPETGILLCAAPDLLSERWRMLVQSCDDYLAKPCTSSELVARVSDVATRVERSRELGGVMRWGPLRVDFVRQAVEVDGNEISLQPLQVRLLGYLMRHAGRAVPHEELQREVFRVAHQYGNTSLARQISVLRTKLGTSGAAVVTFPGGYGISSTSLTKM